ncbi:MAG: methylenetetrahydrofolate reductase C-terminal domain-containing protein [Candidatus Brocadiae bacterium]|nr:methylenetetrahydrofolate reductase C-terminal domain-containing protein [Candidatus Brocadiia bacterium]
MIVADAKPLDEVFGFIEDYSKVLVLGCGECVTVCHVGGEKEVAVLAQQLRLKARTEGKEIEFLENTPRRQCDPEFVDAILEDLDGIDAVVSLACGIGVNFCSDRHPAIPIFPGVNTTFMGATIEHGEWAERCAGCGECILHLTGGICPIARCAKTMLNGPCGGTNDGKCEISTPENPVDCVWSLIVERCKELGTLDKLKEIIAPKDWSTSRDGGPRKRVRPDLKIAEPEEVATKA